MNYEGMRIPVTGGRGFIGSSIVIRLAGVGENVVVPDSAIRGGGVNARNLAGMARMSA